jgi:hypothetical protein
MLKTLVRVAYIQRFVFPGDFASYTESIWEPDDCWDCNSNHENGAPFEQWQNNLMAGPKREENELNKLLEDIELNGVQTPIRISAYRHKVLMNGHHRVYAALDLGWKWIPVEFVDGHTYESFIPAFAPSMIKRWTGYVYTESSQEEVLAS